MRRRNRHLRNVAAIAAMLVLAIGMMIALWRPAPFALPPALRASPAPALDFGDPDVRHELLNLMPPPRADAGNESPLVKRCYQGSPDTFATRVIEAWGINEYIEIRHNAGDTSALAYRWHHAPQSTSASALPIAQTRAVAADDFAAIEAEFLALAERRVQAIRSVDAFDGGMVSIEVCRGGRYNLFVRANRFGDADDRRIVALAERTLAAAGISAKTSF